MLARTRRGVFWTRECTSIHSHTNVPRRTLARGVNECMLSKTTANRNHKLCGVGWRRDNENVKRHHSPAAPRRTWGMVTARTAAQARSDSQGSFLILVMRSLASDCKFAVFPDTSTALDHSTSRTLSNKTCSAYYQLKSWTSPKFTSTDQSTRLSRETLTSHQGWVTVLREAMGGNCSIDVLSLLLCF